MPQKYINSSKTIREALTITGTNNLPLLSHKPISNTDISLIVNNLVYNSFPPLPSFSVTEKQINWNTANSGFSLESTDNVIAVYTTYE
jgi:hypothetical protein